MLKYEVLCEPILLSRVTHVDWFKTVPESSDQAEIIEPFWWEWVMSNCEQQNNVFVSGRAKRSCKTERQQRHDKQSSAADRRRRSVADARSGRPTSDSPHTTLLTHSLLASLHLFTHSLIAPLQTLHSFMSFSFFHSAGLYFILEDSCVPCHIFLFISADS